MNWWEQINWWVFGYAMFGHTVYLQLEDDPFIPRLVLSAFWPWMFVGALVSWAISGRDK